MIVQQTEQTSGRDVTALSTSAVDGLSLDRLLSGSPKYIKVYDLGDEAPPGIACADLPVSGGGSTGEGETTTGGGGATTAGGKTTG